MDGFEFIASLVKSLVWPVTLVTLALIFRRPIRKLFDRLAKRVGKMTEVRAWQVGAKFAEKTSQVSQEIAEEASTIQPPIEPDDPAPVPSGESPREIVMHAWLDLEQYFAAAAEFAGIPPKRHLAHAQLRKYLPPDVVKSVIDLQALRNQAVHMRDFPVSLESAMDYARAASKLGAIMRHPSILMAVKNSYEGSQAATD